MALVEPRRVFCASLAHPLPELEANSSPGGSSLRIWFCLQYLPGSFERPRGADIRVRTVPGSWSDHGFWPGVVSPITQTRQLRPSGPPAETQASRATRSKLSPDPQVTMANLGCLLEVETSRISYYKSHATRPKRALLTIGWPSISFIQYLFQLPARV